MEYIVPTVFSGMRRERYRLHIYILIRDGSCEWINKVVVGYRGNLKCNMSVEEVYTEKIILLARLK